MIPPTVSRNTDHESDVEIEPGIRIGGASRLRSYASYRPERARGLPVIQVLPIRSAFGLSLLLATGCNAPRWYIGSGLGGEDEARQKNKPMLLYFKTWHSTHHRNMGLQVFGQPEVAKEMRETINIELEFSYWPEVERRYGIRNSQVCVMCKPNGRQVGPAIYVNPVPSPEKFLSWFRSTKALAASKPTTRPASPSKKAGGT